MSKVDNIKRGIDRKREQDRLILNETETIINQMNGKKTDINSLPFLNRSISEKITPKRNTS